MPSFSNSIVKNRGLNIDDTPRNSTTKLYLEVAPLSLMNMQTVSNSKLEGQLYYFNINKLPIVSRIIPKDSLIISEEIDTATVNKTEVKFSEIGKNIEKRGNGYYTPTDGFFIYENSSYQILPVIKDAAFSLAVSSDAMKVTGNFFPPAEGAKNITINDILREFKNLKITAHPDSNTLENILSMLQHSSEPIYNVSIVRGTEPKAGKNGWVEYLIETDKNNKPATTEDGRVDFYNLGTILSVEQNQKLAIVHPPITGKAGIDVLGRVTPPAPVKNAESPQGTNTYFGAKSFNILQAKIGGYISITNGKLSISEEYNVSGNIDFHTGNIISKGSVNINGDVKSGFKLDLDKSITINGFVNDAEIKSHGMISITGGFGGSGKGKITAFGNVSVRFVRNQTIYSHADIIIAREAIDANLYAKGSIKSLNGQAIVIGGTTVAEKDVEVNTLGNEFGVKTKIQVGLDYELIEKYDLLKEKIEELKTQLKEREFRVRKYSSIKNLTSSAKQQLSTMVTEYKEKKDALIKLENEGDELKKILKTPSKSKVVVLGIAYPGVEIVIKNTVYKVREMIRKKTFVLSETEEGVIDLK